MKEEQILKSYEIAKERYAAVGVDTDMKCTGISIISHAETSGLGAKAAAASE